MSFIQRTRMGRSTIRSSQRSLHECVWPLVCHAVIVVERKDADGDGDWDRNGDANGNERRDDGQVTGC